MDEVRGGDAVSLRAQESESAFASVIRTDCCPGVDLDSATMHPISRFAIVTGLALLLAGPAAAEYGRLGHNAALDGLGDPASHVLVDDSKNQLVPTKNGTVEAWVWIEPADHVPRRGQDEEEQRSEEEEHRVPPDHSPCESVDASPGPDDRGAPQFILSGR